MPHDSYPVEVTILNSEKVSSVLDIEEGYYLSGLIFPSIDTSTEFNYQVSFDRVNYESLYNYLGTKYGSTIPSASAGALSLPEEDFKCWKSVKLEVADTQSGDKVITCIVQRI